jgi:hypothetical protein
MWLKILASEGDTAQLSWGNNDGPYPDPYKIGLATLGVEAAKVRQRLNALARWGVNRDDAALPGLLSALAAAGNGLYFTLFDGLTSADRKIAAEIREWMGEQFETDSTLCITASSSIHIPWGLVCEQDPETGAPASSIAAFEKLWALKYSLSATLSGYVHPKRKLQRAAGRRRFLTLLNGEVADAIPPDLRGKFREMTDRRPIGPATSVHEFKQLIKGAGRGDTVLHFFGHQSEGSLLLGENSQITVTEFKRLIDDLVLESGGKTDSAGLVFMSACDGAHGDSDYSFVSAANRDGILGLIATESAVPRDFAAIFAMRFLALMEAGASVGEAMAKLRMDSELWPLSLLYGCYAQPEYRFVAEAGT